MSKLKEERTKKGLSQEKMAQLLGYTNSMYCKLESGSLIPSRKFIDKYKSVFPEISIEVIFFSN